MVTTLDYSAGLSTFLGSPTLPMLSFMEVFHPFPLPSGNADYNWLVIFTDTRTNQLINSSSGRPQMANVTKDGPERPTLIPYKRILTSPQEY